MLREACLVSPSGRAGERGGLPPNHLASSIPLHYRIILTPSAMQPGTRHCQGLAGPGTEHVGNTMPIVMLPDWEQDPKAAGHHPKPCLLLSCQEEALRRADGEEESHILF